MTFLAIQEAKIRNSKKFSIPEELEDAWLIKQGVSWRDVRTIPQKYVDDLKALSYLENFHNSLDHK